MSENINITVGLSIKVCYCGTVYAVPSWMTRYDCPTCASRRLAEKENELRAARNEERRLSLRIFALQGVITKMKARKGAPCAS
jgi:hypothetical protein